MNERKYIPKQIVNYIYIYKAQCKKMRYKGRIKKCYEVPGTEEYEKLKQLRQQLLASLEL